MNAVKSILLRREMGILAAIIVFSVAPTDGNGSVICVPVRLSA